ncbi:2-oxoisovalerate dehydrogenase subunit alpha [Venturia inaequalis]|nr:2-oxoisovalerate dehydrogenase subunit alpha [Venturia inaequalis]
MASTLGAIAAADGPKTICTTAPTAKQPTSFLSLPLELRQKILYQSLDIGLDILRDLPKPNIALEEFHSYIQVVGEERIAKAKDYNFLWQQVVSMVYPTAKDDVHFVSKMWDVEVDGLLEECNTANTCTSDSCCMILRSRTMPGKIIAFQKYLSDRSHSLEV